MPNVEMTFDGEDCFIIFDGLKIARRENGAWVSLEPGWAVFDDAYSSPDPDAPLRLSISYKRARVQ
jgi:hypothetical protein